MATNKDIHVQFLQETGDRVPQSVKSGLELHKYSTEKEYINWLEEKLLEEWNSK